MVAVLLLVANCSDKQSAVGKFIQNTPFTIFTETGKELPTLEEFIEGHKNHNDNYEGIESAEAIHYVRTIPGDYSCKCIVDVTQAGTVNQTLVMKALPNGSNSWGISVDYSDIGDDNWAIGFLKSIKSSLDEPDLVEPRVWGWVIPGGDYQIVFDPDNDKIYLALRQYQK